MKAHRFFYILLTGFGLSFLNVVAIHAAETPVTITLDPQHPGAAIAPDFSGLSFEVSILLPNKNGIHYFRPDNLPLINLFHTLDIKSLRIGGNTSDRDAKQLPVEADLDSLFAFAKAAGVQVIYCLRLHDGDPQADAATAKYIMGHYAPQVDCFSIGQEPSAYPKPYAYSNYSKAWKEFADTIIAAVPDVKFCGPSVHNNADWARRFMADFGRSNHVVLITEHLYAGGAGNRVPSPEIGRERMLAAADEMTNSFPRVYKKLHDGFVPLAISNSLPYRLEEANNYFNGGATNVSNTFASALWGLDFMHWWAAHGAAGMNFHTGNKVAAGYTLQPSKYTAFFSTTNGYVICPLGYGIKAFELGSHGKVIPVTISNPDNLNLSAYAVLGDDKNLCLTIINKEHGETGRDATISIAQNHAEFSSERIISLTVPNNDIAATANETLGGAAIENDGSWNGKWAPLETKENAPLKFNVHAGSAAIVRLTNR